MFTTQTSAILAAATASILATPLMSQKIGARFNISTSGDIERSDIAFSSGSGGEYLAVWSRKIGSVVQIRAQRLNGSGSKRGAVLSITSGLAQKDAPTVAYIEQRNRWLVAWQQKVGGKWTIRGRTVVPGTGSMTPSAELSTNVADCVSPRLGGDRSGSDDDAILIYKVVGSGLRSRQVTVFSSVAPGPHASIKLLSLNSGDESPQISKSGGAARNYIVAWRRNNGAADNIYARALDRNGNPIGSEVAVAQTGWDDSSPSVDGSGRDFYVAWARREFLSPGRFDIYARKVLVRSGKAEVAQPALKISATANVDERLPAVSYLGPKVAIAWSHATLGTRRLRFQMRAPIDLGASGNVFEVAGSKGQATRPKIASTYAGGSAADQGIISFLSEATSSPFDGDLDAQRIEAIGDGGTVTNLGGGCGFGGKIEATTPFAIGNGTFRVELTSADQKSKIAIMNIAPFGPPLLNCGTCQISEPTILFGLPMVGGGARMTLPVPHDVSLIGGSVQFQAYVLETSSTPCAGLTGLAFSNRLRAVIGQ